MRCLCDCVHAATSTLFLDPIPLRLPFILERIISLIHEFKFDIPIIRNVDSPMSTCHLYILINNLRIIPSDSQILTKRGRNKTIVVMVDPSCIQFYLYLSWTVVCVRKLTQLCSTPVGFYSIFHIIVPFLPQRGTQNCLIILCSILVEHCFQWAFSLNKVALRDNLPSFLGL